MRKESNTVGEPQGIVRLAARNLAEEYLPTSIKHTGEGLQRSRMLIADGYNILVMTTHPSETDEPRQYAELWRYGEFIDRKIHVPCASDQNTPLVNLLARTTGVTLYSVVTDDVIKRNGNVQWDSSRWGFRKLPKGHGNMGYFRGVMRAAANENDPAVIFLAPDAGRRPALKTPKTRAAEFLMTVMRDNRFAILFIGVEIDEVLDYTRAGGKNIGMRYTMHIGDCFKDTEILTELEKFKKSRFEESGELLLPVHNIQGSKTVRRDRPFYGVEEWMYETQFPSLVPEAYKKPLTS